MEVYLIRHGQSLNNAQADRAKRLSDPPLTDIGRRQAQLLAQHLSTGLQLKRPPEGTEYPVEPARGISRLLCSPMWRALQTAQPVARALYLVPEVWVAIHERGGVFLDGGETGGIVGYPGKTRQEMMEEFAGFVLPQGVTEAGWWFGGREDEPASQQRAAAAAEEMWGWASGNDSAIIVSHGGFLNALLKALLGQAANERLYFDHYNTGISRLHFTEDGRLIIRYLNRVPHLLPDLIT